MTRFISQFQTNFEVKEAIFLVRKSLQEVARLYIYDVEVRLELRYETYRVTAANFPPSCLPVCDVLLYYHEYGRQKAHTYINLKLP